MNERQTDRLVDWLFSLLDSISVCIDPTSREREGEKRNNRRRKEIA